MVRIAVCSRNGIAVDEHLARAACFYIYDVGRNTFGLAGMRLNRNTGEHPLDDVGLNGIYGLINDCEFLFTAVIEPGVRRWLESKNVTVVSGHHSVTQLIGMVKALKKKEMSRV